MTVYVHSLPPGSTPLLSTMWVALLLMPVQPTGDATMVPGGIVKPEGIASTKAASVMGDGYVL